MISTDDLILSTLHDAVDGIDANVNMIDKGLREGIIYWLPLMCARLCGQYNQWQSYIILDNAAIKGIGTVHT